MITFLIRREVTGLNILSVRFEGINDIVAEVSEFPDEFGLFAEGESEAIVQDEDLSGGIGTCADADDGDREFILDLRGEGARDAFECESEDAGILECVGVFDERIGLIAFSLDVIAGEDVNGLRSESEVPHDGDAGIDESPSDIDDACAAFDFDGMSAGFLKDADTGFDAVIVGGLVASEGHIDDDEGIGATAHDALCVVDDVIDGDGQGCTASLHGISEAIADEDHIDAGEVDEFGKGGVIGGNHDDFLPINHFIMQICDSQCHGRRLLKVEHMPTFFLFSM